MAVQVPTAAQLLEVAAEIGLDAHRCRRRRPSSSCMRPSVDAYNVVDAMPDNLPRGEVSAHAGLPARPARRTRTTPGTSRPRSRARPSGKLKGKTVVLKDNIMLAGVPMMNGASTLEGYMPDIDATVVTRILDAGGTIVGKAHCEYFCLSGGSHTNATGPVHNPHKMGYSAGGSSSGSAVLVALGEVDMAIGGDQGGSIRMPASFCGIYGMKPTHGLVPYTGIMPIEIYVDHTGPMTANGRGQRAAARGAGRPRRLRPAAVSTSKVHPYTKALRGRRRGPEDRRGDGGLRPAECRGATSNAKVQAAAEQFEQARRQGQRGLDPHAPASRRRLWMPIGVEGLTQTMMWGDGYGVSRPDLYVTSLMDFHRSWRNRANEMSETTKLFTHARHLHPPATTAAATTARR